jgi:hypothetical protein
MKVGQLYHLKDGDQAVVEVLHNAYDAVSSHGSIAGECSKVIVYRHLGNEKIYVFPEASFLEHFVPAESEALSVLLKEYKNESHSADFHEALGIAIQNLGGSV